MRYKILSSLAVAMLACGGGEEASPPPVEEVAPPSVEQDSLAQARAEAAEVRRMVAQVINFDFDKSTIRPGPDTRVLQEKAAILTANPALALEIVGHCDERGTRAYNQALGMRRAESARRYLVGLGVAQGRLTVSSMGEDQPVDPGRNETAWAQNRRAEFRIVAGGDALRGASGM